MTAPGNKSLIPFFAIIFAGAMVVGPLLHATLGGILPSLTFHRAMDRALLISAVAALLLYRSSIPLGKLWPLDSSAWKHYLLGWAASLVTAQAALGAILACAGLTWIHHTPGAIAGRVVLALVAALIVPLLEETVFRGFLQTELISRLGFRAGWILAAVLYALAHFLKVPTEFDHQPVHLWSGVTAIGAAFSAAAQGGILSWHGLNLLILGLILGGTFLRCGTLWFNAGLHGGFIFTLLLSTWLTHTDEPPTIAGLGGDLLSNPLTAVVLILLGIWLWRFYQPHSVAPETGEIAP